VSPFSLLLSEDEELGLDEEALPENGRVLQSVKHNIYLMSSEPSLSVESKRFSNNLLMYVFFSGPIFPIQTLFFCNFYGRNHELSVSINLK